MLCLNYFKIPKGDYPECGYSYFLYNSVLNIQILAIPVKNNNMISI